MHVLTIVDHPNPASLSHAVAKRFLEGVIEAGHTTELGDLHAEGFDPRLFLQYVSWCLATNFILLNVGH